eukprot:gene5156-8762_t
MSMSAVDDFVNDVETIEQENKIFGSTVDNIIKRNDHKDEFFPILMKHCGKIFILNEDYLKKDGIFRQSSVLFELIEMADMYNEEQPNFEKIYVLLNKKDELFVASLLRKFLMDLSTPLMGYTTEGVMNLISKIDSKDTNEYISIIKQCFDSIPKCQKSSLNLLFYILNKTSKLNENMKAENLGKCISMGLCRYKGTPTMEDMAKVPVYNKITSDLIEHYEKIFNGEDDKMEIEQIIKE